MRIDQNQTPMQRVENRCRTNANGCWVWFGAVKNKQDPVPIFNNAVDGIITGRRTVQRAIYEFANKVKLPRNHAIVILCGNRRCCNPAHLTTRTFSEMRAETMAKIKRKQQNENQ
jgi:hypothetical protein